MSSNKAKSSVTRVNSRMLPGGNVLLQPLTFRRHTNIYLFRAYSAVTTTSCAIGAISWSAWRRIDRAQHEAEVQFFTPLVFVFVFTWQPVFWQQERAARFLAMTPSFSGISDADIHNLAGRVCELLKRNDQFADRAVFFHLSGDICQGGRIKGAVLRRPICGWVALNS